VHVVFGAAHPNCIKDTNLIFFTHQSLRDLAARSSVSTGHIALKEIKKKIVKKKKKEK
jgi:hypothetical protein